MSRILIAGLVFGVAALAADAGAELFQKAVTEERAAGNLEAAIKLYQRVAREFASNRPLAAKALVQEARCYEKLGQDKAVGLYQQVAREFGDQPEQAAAARERLAALGAVAKSKAGTEMMAHRIPIPPTAQFSESDGKHIFYLDPRAGGLMAARMDGTDPRVILPLPAHGGRSMVAEAMSVSRDGKKVAVNAMEGAGKSSFLVVGTDGSGIQMTYLKTGPDVQPEGGWSPDGVHFVGDIEESDGTHVVAILSAVDGSARKIRNDFAKKGKGALVASVAGRNVFSPDGKYVVFGVRTGTGMQSEIRIVAVDGSSGGKLVQHPSVNSVIDFTPDGKHLLFESDRSGSAGIYALAVSDGKAQGEPMLIKQEAGMLSKASLTKDGVLFYSVGEQNRLEIFTAKLDAVRGTLVGAAQVFPGHSGMTPESGKWSPDGQRFAYLSGRDHGLGGGEATLTIRTLASGKEVEYKVSPNIEAIVGWAADGRGVLVATGVAMRLTPQPLELHSISTDTGGDTTLATFPGAVTIYSVRPPPDGKALLIAFGAGPGRTVREAGLVRLDPQTGQQTELISKGIVSEIAISPDGTQVAALDRQANSARLLLKSLSGGDWKTLATLQGKGYMYLNWMSNGWLMFGKEESPDSTLFRISTSGGTPEKVSELPSLSHVHQIQVSPDDRQLVFQSLVNHMEAWTLENFLPKEMTAR